MCEIIALMPGEDRFHLFEHLPRSLYPEKSFPLYSSQPVNKEFISACYILTDNGNVKARCALYSNPFLYFKSKKTACIGNYECVNDDSVSKKLLARVTNDARNLGNTFLVGPMNGSTWDNYRFSVNHDHPLFFTEHYHHLYYNQQFINNEFEVIATYFSSIDKEVKSDNPTLLELEENFKLSGVSFRNIDMDHYEDELEKIYELNIIAFRNNFLYTPISKQAFIKKYYETKKYIDPEIVMLAEDEEKNLIGYFFCLNDIYNNLEKSIIVKTVARHPDKKWSRIGHVMGNIMYRTIMKKEYKSIIHSFMYREGTSTGISKNFYGQDFKEYLLYGKKL